MKPSIFTPNIERVKKLDAREATHLVRDLLYCGALPMRLSEVVISERINAKDGGIDAKVIAEAAVPGRQAVSFHFQIKSGDSFEPWQEAVARKEIFGKSNVTASKDRLGAAVKRCLDTNGVYVLVASGHDLLPEEHSKAEAHLRKAFADCGYPNAEVKVWGAGKLASLLRSYPSLSLELNGIKDGEFETVRQWGARADLGGVLAIGDAQKRFMKRLADILRGGAIQHARVIGEPGCGKTRLVLETIRGSDDLAARCVYVASSAALLRSGSLLTELINEERGYWTILVVDECDEVDRATIYNVIKGKQRIKLVTIDHGPEVSRDTSMETIEFPTLGDKEIGAILGTYLVGSGDLHNWTEWCKGSARSAHVLGENLALHPEDILKSPATVNVWERFVIGYKRADSPEAQRLLTEMRHIALFSKFGFKKPIHAEGKFVGKLAKRVDGSITKGAFERDVAKFVKRRILQGDRTLRIVPQALHVHLWREWWSNYGITANLNELLKELPESLLSWFTNMMRYANGSPEAQAAVKELLDDPKSPFAKRKFLRSDRGSRFLSALAEADPASTLALLERTTDVWIAPMDPYLGQSQDFVFAIERIAVWAPHFTRAAELLVKLAAIEKSSYDNNARGTLRKLFGIAGAPSQANPMVRIEFIARLFGSTESFERKLGLELCGKILETRGGTRVIGVEYQGLLPTIRLWAPKIWEDLYTPWRAALAMLLEQASSFDPQWQHEVSREIIRACFGLMGHTTLVPLLLRTLEGQLMLPGADHEALVKALLHFERFPLAKPTPATKRRLAKLLGTLSNGPYERRFARFVEYETYDENYTVSESGEHADSPLPSKRVETLAHEMLSSPEIAASHLDYVIQSQGYRIRIFGHQIGKLADSGFRSLAIQRAKSLGAAGGGGFIVGFLNGTREVDPADADVIVLDLLAGRAPADWQIAATIQSGVSQAMMPKLVKLAKTAPPALFVHVGYQVKQAVLPPDEVEALLRSLLRNKSLIAANVALDIGFYWFGRSSGPQCAERLHWKLVTDHRLFGDNMRQNSHQWEAMVKAFRGRFPNLEVNLLAVLLNPKKRTQSYAAASETFGVLGAICAAKPEESWEIVAAALEGKSHAWTVSHWLGGGIRDDASPTPIEAFSAERIFNWIDKSPRERIARTLDFIPKTLTSPGGDLTAAFIERFGSKKGFNDALAFRFGLGAYSGPPSEHHAAQREQAIKWAGATASIKVKAFLDAYIGELTKLIDRERMHEERS